MPVEHVKYPFGVELGGNFLSDFAQQLQGGGCLLQQVCTLALALRFCDRLLNGEPYFQRRGAILCLADMQLITQGIGAHDVVVGGLELGQRSMHFTECKKHRGWDGVPNNLLTQFQCLQ